jgi:hypothetical protein
MSKAVSVPTFTPAMNALLINNLKRLRWEHTVQFVGSLEKAPYFEIPVSPEDVPDFNATTALAFPIIKSMEERESSSKKGRVVGAVLLAMDIEYRNLINDRNTTARQWRSFYRDLLALEYERNLVELSTNCWLPVEPNLLVDGENVNRHVVGIQVEDELLHSRINALVDTLRQKEGCYNNRDQITEAKITLERYIKTFKEGCVNEH